MPRKNRCLFMLMIDPLCQSSSVRPLVVPNLCDQNLSLRSGPPLSPQSVLTPSRGLGRSTLDELDELVDVEVSLLADTRSLGGSSGSIGSRDSGGGGGRSGRAGSSSLSSRGRGDVGTEASLDRRTANTRLSGVESLKLSLSCLSTSNLLSLDILDHSSEELDISSDLLGLHVLGTKSLLEDRHGLLRGGQGGGDVASKEVSLGELVERLSSLDVLGAEELRSRLVSSEQQSQRERVFGQSLEDNTGVRLGLALFPLHPSYSQGQC